MPLNVVAVLPGDKGLILNKEMIICFLLHISVLFYYYYYYFSVFFSFLMLRIYMLLLRIEREKRSTRGEGHKQPGKCRYISVVRKRMFEVGQIVLYATVLNHTATITTSIKVCCY